MSKIPKLQNSKIRKRYELNFFIDEKLYNRLWARVSKTRLNKSQIARMALEKYLTGRSLPKKI